MRSINSMIIATVANLAIIETNGPILLVFILMVAVDLGIFALIDYINDQDNMYLFSFLASLPFVLYWTETYNEATAPTFPLFFATTALCVALPFIFFLLFHLWNFACEE